jgi:hypothetical protein
MPMKRITAVLLMVGLLAVPALEGQARAQSQSSPTNALPPPAATNAGTAQLTSTNGAPPGPSPAISGVTAQVFTLGVPQKLVLTGTNFQEGATVTLTSPSGAVTKAAATQARRVSATELEVDATLGETGDWEIAVQNTNAATVATTRLKVALAAPDATMVRHYESAARIVTRLVVFAVLIVVASLIVASARGKWSLADALSEESSVQPAAHAAKKDINMVASSSRLIALVGLLGILTLVLGVGYAIIWRLFVFGAVPDLSQVRNFLFGAACLFAPYLANQLSGVFGTRAPSGGEQPSEGAAPAGASIHGMAPAVLSVVQPQPQQVSFTGSGFAKGLSVTLTDPNNAEHTITGPGVTVGSSSLITVSCALNLTGEWTASVKNLDEDPSDDFRFTVLGPPQIGGVRPPNPTQGVPANLTFDGAGFLDGMTVQFTLPGAAPAVPPLAPAAISVTHDHFQVQVTFPRNGLWHVVATNPGPHNSNDFPMQVN